MKLLSYKQEQLAQIETRLQRLLDIYIEGSLARDEYTTRKEQYLDEKASLTEDITGMKSGEGSRFKPVDDFITASRTARSTAWTEHVGELSSFHKGIGSNLILAAEDLTTEGRKKGQSDSCRRHRRRSVPEGDEESTRKKRSHSIGGFAAENNGHCDFIPILPDSDLAAAFGVKGFRSLGSKTDCGSPKPRRAKAAPVLHVQYDMPWAILAHAERKSGKISNWRRGRDSNPRYPFARVQRISNPPLSTTQPPLQLLVYQRLTTSQKNPNFVVDHLLRICDN